MDDARFANPKHFQNVTRKLQAAMPNGITHSSYELEVLRERDGVGFGRRTVQIRTSSLPGNNCYSKVSVAESSMTAPRARMSRIHPSLPTARSIRFARSSFILRMPASLYLNDSTRIC